MKNNAFGSRIFYLLTLVFLMSAITVNAQTKKDRSLAKKLAEEGEKSFKQKDYKTTVEKYGQSTALVSNNPAAHFQKGFAHYYLNEFDQALVELDKALSQGFAPPLEIYKVRWLLNFQKKNYDAALEDALKILQFEPSNLAVNSAVGEIYLAKNSYPEALDAFQKTLRLDPNNADANYFAALAYQNLGDYEKQRLFAVEAINKKTKYVGESYFISGDALQKAKNYNEAIEAYRKSLSAKPDSYTVYQNLSDLYRRQNKFEEAVEVAKKAVEVFPNDANLYNELSRYYSLADRSALAVGAAQQAVKLMPEKYSGYASLCRAYYENKQFESALQACNSALKFSPNDGETNIYLGFTYLSLDKTEAANEYFKKAVAGLKDYTQKNPEYTDGFYLLGNAYYYANQPENAIEAYSRSLQLNPQFSKARFNLGLAYFVSGKTTAAREQYEALLKADKDLAEKLKKTLDKKQ